MLPRADTTGFGKHQGKESITKVVRATNKAGAIFTARLDAMTSIPLRDQKVVVVDGKTNERVFDQWEVKIVDVNEISTLGR